MHYKRVIKIVILMMLCFFAGIVYNPLKNDGVKETKDKTIRFERHWHDDANSHNRISAYINMLYTLSFNEVSSICYFDAPSIRNNMPLRIRYENKKYWRKGALTVLRDYYVPLLDNPELIKKYPEIQFSYDLIKADNLWALHSTESNYLQSVEYLKKLQEKLIAEKKYIPAGFSSGLTSIKKELSFLAERLNNNISELEQSEAQVLLHLDEIDDLIYEAQGGFWAMGFMIMGTTSEVVVYLNDQELMDDLTNVHEQLYKMYKDEHTRLHEEEKYHINIKYAKIYMDNAGEVMKKQLQDITYLLSLVTKLQCNKLCQMRKRNNIKGY